MIINLRFFSLFLQKISCKCNRFCFLNDVITFQNISLKTKKKINFYKHVSRIFSKRCETSRGSLSLAGVDIDLCLLLCSVVGLLPCGGFLMLHFSALFFVKGFLLLLLVSDFIFICNFHL